MTLVVHVRRGIIGHGPVETFSEPWEGQTAGELARRYRRLVGREWEGIPLAVCVNGRELRGRELELGLPDGVDVVIAPRVQGIELGAALLYALIAATVSTAVGFVVRLLMGQQKPAGVPQQPGEQSSPTYAFAGVQTTYGQGHIVPIAYGEHDLGGHVIYTDVFASTGSGAVTEYLRVVLALSEGRIDSIGGVSGGPTGEFDALGGYSGGTSGGTIPANIRVNGNLLDVSKALPGALVWGRMGELDQNPLPSNPFRGATTTLVVNEQLDDAGDSAIFTVSSSEQIATVAFVLAFPGGIYSQNTAGQIVPYPVDFTVDWRRQGETSWRAFLTSGGAVLGRFTVGATSSIAAVAFTVGANVPQGQAAFGPLEVRVTRHTARGGLGDVSSCVWRQAVYNLNHEFAYPRTALLGLELAASEKVSGGLPQFLVRVRGKRVRVWDDVNGWSAYTWDVPAAPHAFHTYPPGNNPAWVAVDYLLSPWGLGAWIDEDDLDLQSFRDWAAFCDSEPNPANPWNEPRCRFDGVFDRSRPAWENLLSICQAGLAVPFMRGSRIAVRYSYRDSHQDLGLTIPAKSSTQLFSDANVADVSVDWLSRAFRPTVIEFQFVNAAKNYRPDTYPVEDPASTIAGTSAGVLNPDQWRKETVQAFGIVRTSQLERDGQFMHRIQRLVRKRISFRTGPWALALEPGDRFTFQHNVLRPFDEDTLGLTIRTGGTSVSSVVVDRVLTPSGGTDQLIVRNPDGTPQAADVTSIVGTTVNLASAVTCDPGAPAAFGVRDRVVEDYECVSVNLTEDLEREVVGLEWNDDVFDPIDPVSSSSPSTVIGQSEGFDRFATPPAIAADDVRVRAEPLEHAAHRVSFLKPAGYESRPARVWVRVEGAGQWIIAGETRDTSVVVRGLAAWSSFEIAVTVANRNDIFRLPDDADAATVTADEFPPLAPPNVSTVRVLEIDGGRRIEWERIEGDEVTSYEVRRGGAHWWAAPVVYAGREPACFDLAPPHRGTTYHVSARNARGLYSPIPATATVDAWAPRGTFSAIDVDEIASSASGTLDGVSVVSSAFELDADRFEGSYTSPAQSLGYDGAPWWAVSVEGDVVDDETVDEWGAWELDAGEGLWRLIDGRPSSPGLPGIDWAGPTVDGLDPQTIDELGRDFFVHGEAGEHGDVFALEVESRYLVGGAWSAWARHRNGRKLADSIQVRVTLRRERTGVTVRATQVRVAAYV